MLGCLSTSHMIPPVVNRHNVDRLAITARRPDVVPCTIRVAANQAANTLEMQDAAGAVKNYWGPTGTLGMRVIAGDSSNELQITQGGNLTTTLKGVNNSGSAVFVFQSNTTGSLGFLINTTPYMNLSRNGSIRWESTSATVQAAAPDTAITCPSAGVLRLAYGTNPFGGAYAALQCGAPTSSTVPITSTLAASQSADGFQQQNSVGTVQISFSSAGAIDVGSNATFRGVTNSFFRTSTQYGYMMSGLDVFSSGPTATSDFGIRAIGHFGISTNNSATPSVVVTTAGLVGINKPTSIGGQHHVVAGTSSTVGGIYQGAASQSGDLLQQQNSVGTVLSRVDSAGNIITTQTLYADSISGNASTSWNSLGSITMSDAKNLIFNTTTGTKLGTATGQKLGFWNATPVVQQVLATGAGRTVDDVITFLQTVGLCKQS